MKRLSWIAGIAALLFGVLSLAPGIASAQGNRGGGWRGGATYHAGGYHAATVGGGRNYVAARQAYVAPRGVPPHGGYAAAPYGGGWRVHPYSAVGIGVRPSPRHVWVPGYWGWRGGARVWVGGAWLLPQTNWGWIAPHWQWNGVTWVWAQGYWAPPY
jgi:hypothetical protein